MYLSKLSHPRKYSKVLEQKRRHGIQLYSVSDPRTPSVPKFRATNRATPTSTESIPYDNKAKYSFLFAGDWFKPYHLEVPKILERGVPILIYAGDADYICKYLTSLSL